MYFRPGFEAPKTENQKEEKKIYIYKIDRYVRMKRQCNKKLQIYLDWNKYKLGWAQGCTARSSLDPVAEAAAVVTAAAAYQPVNHS